MPSPTYQQNKEFIKAYRLANMDKCRKIRMKCYYNNKNPFFVECRIFRNILIKYKQ